MPSRWMPYCCDGVCWPNSWLTPCVRACIRMVRLCVHAREREHMWAYRTSHCVHCVLFVMCVWRFCHSEMTRVWGVSVGFQYCDTSENANVYTLHVFWKSFKFALHAVALGEFCRTIPRCVLHRTCGVVAAVSVPVLSLCVCALWHLFYSTLNAFKCVKYATKQILRSINTATISYLAKNSLRMRPSSMCVHRRGWSGPWPRFSCTRVRVYKRVSIRIVLCLLSCYCIWIWTFRNALYTIYNKWFLCTHSLTYWIQYTQKTNFGGVS